MSKQTKPAQAAATQVPAGKKVVKTLTGKVVSNKMQKTITVAVERYVPRPEYGKYQRRTTIFCSMSQHDSDESSCIRCSHMSHFTVTLL